LLLIEFYKGAIFATHAIGLLRVSLNGNQAGYHSSRTKTELYANDIFLNVTGMLNLNLEKKSDFFFYFGVENIFSFDVLVCSF
jgi:hypothetical protein